MKGSRPFLVLGLPRSRTAWLSCLLTHGNSFCFHDLTSRCENAAEVIRRIIYHPSEVVGNSDSGNTFILEKFMEILPDTRLIWIYRNPDDVIESMARILGKKHAQLKDPIHRLQARNQQLRARFGGVVYGISELDDEEAMRALWRIVTDGQEFPFEHWRRMKTMRVSVHNSILIDAFTNGSNSEIVKDASTLLAGRPA